MKEIRIGTKIIEKRKAKGLTQEELADHLGVSKPAVSKWESGQSYPDITLLPVIASYFDISVDELFDYQPQLGKAEIRKLYQRMAELFVEKGFEEAYIEWSFVVKKYYSCWPLLLNMGVLVLNNAALASTKIRTEEAIREVIHLFDRIATYGDDPKIMRQLPMYKATAHLMLGEASEVIDLLEDTQTMPMNADVMLAHAYMLKNDTDKALGLLQGSIFLGVVNLLGSYPVLFNLYKDRPIEFDRWVTSAMQLIATYAMERTHPGTILPIHVSAAIIYLVNAQPEKALDHLEAYTRIVCAPGMFPVVLKGNPLFDRIDGLFESLDLGTAAPRSDVAIRQSIKDVILKQPAFEVFADNERFKRIVRAIEAL
jgi:transcriptional regulator with XRE-family HTH domain